MSENPSGRSQIRFRFVPSVFPLNLNSSNTLAYREFGKSRFVDLQKAGVDEDSLRKLKSEGLSEKAFYDLNLSALLDLGLVETFDSEKIQEQSNSDLKLTIISLLSFPLTSAFELLSRNVRSLKVVEHAHGIEHDELAVVFAERLDDPRLQAVVNVLQNNHQKWIFAQLESSQVLLGPMFGDPGSTHCFRCFCARRNSSLQTNRLSLSPLSIEWRPLVITWIELQILLHVQGRRIGNPSRLITVFEPGYDRLALENYIPAPLCDVCG